MDNRNQKKNLHRDNRYSYYKLTSCLPMQLRQFHTNSGRRTAKYVEWKDEFPNLVFPKSFVDGFRSASCQSFYGGLEGVSKKTSCRAKNYCKIGERSV